MTDLGTRVKSFRLQQKMSVRELAKRAGVSVSYVYAVESGHRGHNIVKLGKIAKALGVPVSALWEGSDEQ
ncbi:helix-turn-helix transcriptional regulator [Alicyclobacillus cycloheptanicus]|jgi:transcriptional regulator with XRE-family HTH domain|uniref:Transcriptional regulator with XRE-family HTH domain n=1 Tax=Alicyclobacillus cycloheptanicus TaxID=1457 RepID=A0ABT9XHF8_9BACL|nr:helix-turn-helix transcriptional regulator [Alicyclobacillus cycloheptanicus]MDQ0189720.1 transcriptional regulator with XRE-family HTH domain [Alicyclobacillus cycloheptanicus]WDM01932.1 helix-turn-helix transcriptional regulator [Alicyclobacillus cycloheptanicus]